VTATIETLVLAAVLVFLSLTAHGAVSTTGVAGGAIVVGLVTLPVRLPPLPALGALTLAVAPFAMLTWWSVVGPLVAALIVICGTFALVREVEP